MVDLSLHRGDLAIDLGNPRLDLTLRNLAVDGSWVTGEVEVKASAFGRSLDQTLPFKTLNDGEESFDLGVASLALRVHLETPHRVCASADLSWGPVHVSVPNQCTDF